VCACACELGMCACNGGGGERGRRCKGEHQSENEIFTTAYTFSMHYIALQRTATHCNALQHTATHCNALQRTATHCNALQHTATLCNAHLLRRLTTYMFCTPHLQFGSSTDATLDYSIHPPLPPGLYMNEDTGIVSSISYVVYSGKRALSYFTFFGL